HRWSRRSSARPPESERGPAPGRSVVGRPRGRPVGGGALGASRSYAGCLAGAGRRSFGTGRIERRADAVLMLAVLARVIDVEGADDVAHQAVAHHVLGMEVDELDVRYVPQDGLDLHQARAGGGAQ